MSISGSWVPTTFELKKRVFFKNNKSAFRKNDVYFLFDESETECFTILYKSNVTGSILKMTFQG